VLGAVRLVLARFTIRSVVESDMRSLNYPYDIRAWQLRFGTSAWVVEVVEQAKGGDCCCTRLSWGKRGRTDDAFGALATGFVRRL
jgi:hypothetical protein